MAFMPLNNSDQPWHVPSLIKVVTVHPLDDWIAKVLGPRL